MAGRRKVRAEIELPPSAAALRVRLDKLAQHWQALAELDNGERDAADVLHLLTLALGISQRARVSHGKRLPDGQLPQSVELLDQQPYRDWLAACARSARAKLGKPSRKDLEAYAVDVLLAHMRDDDVDSTDARMVVNMIAQDSDCAPLRAYALKMDAPMMRVHELNALTERVVWRWERLDDSGKGERLIATLRELRPKGKPLPKRLCELIRKHAGLAAQSSDG